MKKVITYKKTLIEDYNKKFSICPIPLVLSFGYVVSHNKYSLEMLKRRRITSIKYHSRDILIGKKIKHISRI